MNETIESQCDPKKVVLICTADEKNARSSYKREIEREKNGLFAMNFFNFFIDFVRSARRIFFSLTFYAWSEIYSQMFCFCCCRGDELRFEFQTGFITP